MENDAKQIKYVLTFDTPENLDKESKFELAKALTESVIAHFGVKEFESLHLTIEISNVKPGV